MEISPATLSSQCQLPSIRRLTIERFRGVEKLVWYPNPGVNIILGGGDVGKTTVLDAISLLFSPTNSTVLSEADYWHRKIADGFCIEAVMSLPNDSAVNWQGKHAWPWVWDGKEPQLPVADGAPDTQADSVFRFRARGTPDFDLVFEMFQPDGTSDHLSSSVRRKVGLIRLGGDDRNDRDLRMIQGSALDKLLSDRTLRARLGQKVAESDIEGALESEAKSRLRTLDRAFEAKALPTGLGLGLTGTQGLSLNALIGLIATKDNTPLPLASWGAGTRRLAALEIAANNQKEHGLILVDELERGLEPYRQRVLVAELQRSRSQVFLTTHSATALNAATEASVWYLDSKGAIGLIPNHVIAHRRKDSEAFLSRLTIVAEGITEVGFVRALLLKAIGRDYLDHGIWITDGAGNEQMRQLLEGLAVSGIAFAGFADNDGTFPDKWQTLKATLGDLLFRWPLGGLEKNIIELIPPNQLQCLFSDPLNEQTGFRLRTLATRLGITEKDFEAVRKCAPDLNRLIIEAASGVIPADKKDASKEEKKALKAHGASWFKSEGGGEELAAKVFEFGLWPTLEPQFLPFLNAVRGVIALPPLLTLPT